MNRGMEREREKEREREREGRGARSGRAGLTATELTESRLRAEPVFCRAHVFGGGEGLGRGVTGVKDRSESLRGRSEFL